MSFKNRCNYHTGVLVDKALNHLTLSYITEILESASFNSIHLRSSYQYKLSYASLKTPKTNYMLSASSKRGRDIWNSIPLRIKQTNSLNSFKFFVQEKFVTDTIRLISISVMNLLVLLFHYVNKYIVLTA